MIAVLLLKGDFGRVRPRSLLTCSAIHTHNGGKRRHRPLRLGVMRAASAHWSILESLTTADVDATVDAPVTGEITALLEAANNADADARRALFERLYAELKLLARKRLAASAGNTLNTTGLVHEAYLKIAQPAGLKLHSRRHFFALAAKAMRQIVIDHARARRSEKRGGPEVCIVGLEEIKGASSEQLASAELLRLDDALAQMAVDEPDLAELVELRFFTGLSVADIAVLQSRGERTVVRNWRRAKVQLYEAMQASR